MRWSQVDAEFAAAHRQKIIHLPPQRPLWPRVLLVVAGLAAAAVAGWAVVL
jgi:hypothetical protein